MNEQTTQQLYKATIAHFIAQKERATATLHLYFTNSYELICICLDYAQKYIMQLVKKFF